MAAQKMLVVPGMPMAALNNVRDENTRQVLQALVDAHNVRNGATGKGENRFITASEVGLVDGNTRIIVTVAGDNTSNSPLIAPAAINRIIADLQASVIESPLFKDLGERVDLVDKPGGIFDRLGIAEIAIINETSQRITADTAEVHAREVLGARVGNNEAALLNEITARVNADNSIVQSVTTQFASVGQNLSLVQQSVTTVSNSVSSLSTQMSQVQASVGANSAAIQQESSARVSADGIINAKYTVKIDNNGYVSGYGLMSTANNSEPFAEFIVRADRFAIGSPTGPGITPAVPFIVLTSPQIVDGQVVQPGVYMDTAVIKNGSIGAVKIGDAQITNAKIGNLAVDTLKIAGASVTVGIYDVGFGNTVPVGGSVTLISRTIDLGDQYNSGLIVSATVYCTADSNETIGFRILVNGVVSGDQRASMRSGFGTLFPTSGFATPNTRFATVVLQAYDPGSGGHSPFVINGSTLSVLGGKR